MSFLQWLTIAFTAFLFILVITYWLGLSKPAPGKDYRREMFSALVGIEGLLLGVFIQEYRVQDKTQEVTHAQQVVSEYSNRVTHLENLTNRLAVQVQAVPAARASVDSIKTVITETKKLPGTMLTHPNRPLFTPHQ